MFYQFLNDIAIIPIISNKFYIGFCLYSESLNKKQDNLSGIVGGIGISMIHENKRINSKPRNSILLRCKESKLVNCLKKCYIIAYIVNNNNNSSNNYNNQISIAKDLNKSMHISAYLHICISLFKFVCVFICINTVHSICNC